MNNRKNESLKNLFGTLNQNIKNECGITSAYNNDKKL